MPPEPRCTVILTSHNYAEYVGDAVRSVLAQDYPNLELIVVEDGSSDESLAVIERTAADAPIPVTVLRNETPAGQGNAINQGYAKATGDVVAFLDSDDFWEPNRVSTVARFMDLVPDGAVYQHQLTTGSRDKRGGLLSADVFRLWCDWNAGDFNIADDYTMAIFSPFLPTSGLTFPRSVLDKVMPLPETIAASPDAYLTRTSVAFGPLASIPLILGTWRDHARNTGKTPQSDFKSYWLPTMLPALNHFYEKHDLPLRLSYDPASRSEIPASLMIGEYAKLITSDGPVSIRDLKLASMPSHDQSKGLAKRIWNRLAADD